MKNYIYVDNSATTRLSSSVLDKMLPYLKENYGNASSNYLLGSVSKKAIEDARENVAKLLNVDSEEIYFTSSGTEADNMAILGVAHKYKNKGKHIITSKFEHHAVLNSCKKLEDEGYEVTYVDVGRDGIIDVRKIKEAIRNDTILISIMYVNNEIGTIQNVEEIARIARRYGIIFHTDGVQAVPHIKIDASKFDLMSISGHKFNGPKGIGALYIKKGIEIEPLIYGGKQENGLRPGTENVAGIVGLSEALSFTYKDLEKVNDYERKLRDYLLSEIKRNMPDIEINGDMEKRIPGNLNISIPDIDTSELMVFLDMYGVFVSTGSACDSNTTNVTHVLKAIGKNKSSLRITISKYNTVEEMRNVAFVLKESVKKIKNKKIAPKS